MKKSLFLVWFLVAASAHAQQPVVSTTHGKVQGMVSPDGLTRIFKGIPFAAPPVGELRWKAPQPVKIWKGVRECTAFSASPVQPPPKPFYCWTEEFIAQPEPLSEDCLYLNVWTTAKSAAEKQPVIVWIYGGGFSSGSANCAIYDGEKLAQKGVVFVSINYRVGVFGFMAHPELTKESGYGSSGNYGLLDQLAALKWVQQNIAAFGGDPANVTIAGQSAGAFSVTALIASPLAKGLFHKAIPQSGGLLSNTLSTNLPKAESQGLALMAKTKTNSLAELRKLKAEELLRLSNDAQVGRFGVTLDGYVLPMDLMGHFEKGMHNQTPLLTGWVTGDGSFRGEAGRSVEAYQNEAREKYGKEADLFLRLFPATTPEEVKLAKQKLSLLDFAAVPSHLLASYNTHPSYLYQFGHVPPDKPDFPNYGAFHTSEVPFVLQTLHKWQRPWRDLDKALERVLSSYWVNFAKTGNPNGADLPAWPSYEKTSGAILIADESPEAQEGFLKAEFDFLTNRK